MQYSRCKCGESQCWHSGQPDHSCNICRKCGSTLAVSPGLHQDPEPHDYEWRFDSVTRLAKYIICLKCSSVHRPPSDVGKDIPARASLWNDKDLNMASAQSDG